MKSSDIHWALWRYDWKPEPGSAEASLYSDFLVARDWV
jgi:coproporphyrinogen III oxidase